MNEFDLKSARNQELHILVRIRVFQTRLQSSNIMCVVNLIDYALMSSEDCVGSSFGRNLPLMVILKTAYTMGEGITMDNSNVQAGCR